ncbi:Dabb family protein [Rhodobacteraceae bacterium RKSG542]|uniref:Dabb family protein n=1 Tax=Pseudovibrio flavus TaxID=2529854 RepID=UPI0012BC28C0|nr:Dabb family protein [Pseudovibrio flavus]MTI18466.1 Dabb family protein [Pseudovibrio flavus]
MIRHIVFFTVKEARDYERVYEGLCVLKTNPHAAHIEIGKNLKTDAISNETVDFVVYGEFENKAALDAYKAHETYQQSIDIVRPLRELRIAADFEAE